MACAMLVALLARILWTASDGTQKRDYSDKEVDAIILDSLLSHSTVERPLFDSWGWRNNACPHMQTSRSTSSHETWAIRSYLTSSIYLDYDLINFT
jgi:hypothetical protein